MRCRRNYLGPVLKSAPLIKPVSVAYFGGKLNLFRLNWWKKLFVLIVIQATPGDYRSWHDDQRVGEQPAPNSAGIN